MNKQRFVKILKDYHNISDEDRVKLHELVNTFPYSQILHTMVAKANYDARTDIAEETLHYAAMYATDRLVLKQVIENKPSLSKFKFSKAELIRQSRAQEIAASEKLAQAKAMDKEASTSESVTEKRPRSSPYSIPDQSRKEKISIPDNHEYTDAESLRNNIILDLEALKKSKASYLNRINAHADSESINQDHRLPSPEKNLPVTPTKGESKSGKKFTHSGTKKNKRKNKPAKKSILKDEATGFESTKQLKEQNKLIEKFIKKEPSIKAKPGRLPDKQTDLSESSTIFNEDLISENLARIFVDQGKTGKAIDIYKKLIWKFPQKKTYFASRIEELKK